MSDIIRRKSKGAPLARRRFLTLASATLAAPFVLSGRPLAAPERPPLPIPPLDLGRVKNGVRVFDLDVRRGTHQFFPGIDTRTIGINAGYLGPMVQMRRGERVRLNVTNNIGEKMTLHWHGFELPAWCDGGPHQVIRPGDSWSPEFEVRQRAGSYWAHGHRMGKTAEHVWAGMAMPIRVVEDGGPDLPSEYGVDDLPLVLQERRFARSGQMPYAPSMRDVMMGMSGDVPLVNGAISPQAEVPAGLVRLRILNASNASFYRLAFDDGRPFHMVASDGGLLAAPVKMGSLVLASAERAEIVVDLSDGAPVRLVAETVPIAVGRMGGGMMGGGMMGGGARRFDFLSLIPRGKRRSAALPPELARLPSATADMARNLRSFELEMRMGPAMMMGRGFLINGRAMDPRVINKRVPAATPEIWRITNTSPMMHTFHVHDTQFRLLSRGGRPPAAHERGYKDTVQVMPNEPVDLLVTFPEYRDPERPYMYHCHILEHEDAGMMGQFVVI